MSTASTPSVAVVTIVRNRRDHLARQREWLGRHAPDVPHVIVDMGGDVIEESASTEVLEFPVPEGTALPLAAARNLGARHADADTLIFLDVDCLPCADLVSSYQAGVAEHAGVWSGPVGYLPPTETIANWSPEHLTAISRFHDGRPSPGETARSVDSPDLFWSLSFALHRDTFDEIGGFDESFVGYGGEDTDFGRQVRRSGSELWFTGDALAFHQHHAVSSPPVEHVAAIVDNARRFRDKWGDWPMSGWLEAFVDLGLIVWDPTSPDIALH